MTADLAFILVIEDQPEVLESLELTLQSAGYQVLLALDGSQALSILQSQPVDLMMSDIAMPGMNGYQFYEQVRANPRWATVPFLFLTARALDSDIRYGKELGVDDYLTKPIHREDLLAIIKGKLRRAQQLRQGATLSPSAIPGAAPAILTIGRLSIDPSRYQARLDGQPIHLAAREFALLAYLAQQQNRVVPHHELIQITHELDTDDEEASELLRPLIRSLRRKLGYPVGSTGCIENVRGIGYRLTMQP